MLANACQARTISDWLNIAQYMDRFQTESAYLVAPTRSAFHFRSAVAGAWETYRQIQHRNPRLWSRIFLALIIWTAAVGTISNIGQAFEAASLAVVPGAPIQASLAFSGTSSAAPAKANLASVAHADALPTGPTGQLLPPGTMAPNKTYKNSYAWGQCTWYVAGRRQIPRDWGNARDWLRHAKSAGWSTGAVPAVAAIAWTSAGTYGHVALVEQISPDASQVLISEMNFRSVNVKTVRWVDTSDFKYIY